MAIGRHLEVGVTSIAVHLFSQPFCQSEVQITDLFVMANRSPGTKRPGLPVPTAEATARSTSTVCRLW